MRSAGIAQKLVSEGYEADAIEKTISRLKEVYLLDDRKMAAAVGRYYKDRGDRFIKAKDYFTREYLPKSMRRR
ncbi:MAG: hypothetical protein U1F16_05145 [Turneriella sp.]